VEREGKNGTNGRGLIGSVRSGIRRFIARRHEGNRARAEFSNIVKSEDLPFAVYLTLQAQLSRGERVRVLALGSLFNRKGLLVLTTERISLYLIDESRSRWDGKHPRIALPSTPYEEARFDGFQSISIEDRTATLMTSEWKLRFIFAEASLAEAVNSFVELRVNTAKEG